jgi:hypothetical protein
MRTGSHAPVCVLQNNELVTQLSRTIEFTNLFGPPGTETIKSVFSKTQCPPAVAFAILAHRVSRPAATSECNPRRTCRRSADIRRPERCAHRQARPRSKATRIAHLVRAHTPRPVPRAAGKHHRGRGNMCHQDRAAAARCRARRRWRRRRGGMCAERRRWRGRKSSACRSRTRACMLLGSGGRV